MTDKEIVKKIFENCLIYIDFKSEEDFDKFYKTISNFVEKPNNISSDLYKSTTNLWLSTNRAWNKKLFRFDSVQNAEEFVDSYPEKYIKLNYTQVVKLLSIASLNKSTIKTINKIKKILNNEE